MRIRQQGLRGLIRLSLLPLVFFAAPALSQNLLANPGFDRDLSGWDVRTQFYPPGSADASAAWAPTDAHGGPSGSVRYRLSGGPRSQQQVLLSQCFAAVPGRRYDGGGLLRTDDELQFGAFIRIELFTSGGCAGDPAVFAESAPGSPVAPPGRYNSGGAWVPLSKGLVATSGLRSVRFSVGLDAATGSFNSSSTFDGLFDDAFLFESPATVPTWILPSAARVAGAGGSFWTTTLTLSNQCADAAFVSLKFLGHDSDARGGPEVSMSLVPGTLTDVSDVLSALFAVPGGFGAIRVTCTCDGLVVGSETWTPSSGGTVGQAVPALSAADFIGAPSKVLVPIRENAAFRTNLVLVNTTEAPLSVHVVLYDQSGSGLRVRDVDLPPLGMTQIDRVVSAMGVASLDAGRLSISTPTPGGLFAAYASIIDNVTNDPRTVLPR